MKLRVNGKTSEIPPQWRDESLLFVLREFLGLVGAKYGCGVGLCGACSVIIDDKAVRSCIVPDQAAVDTDIRTIEGLSGLAGGELHPVQQAWLAEAVPQCGYCQAGQIMTAVALLEQNPDPSVPEIDEAMSENLCRCGTYRRIRRAIALAAETHS